MIVIKQKQSNIIKPYLIIYNFKSLEEIKLGSFLCTLGTHIDDEDKTTALIQGTGSNYKSKTTLINESGLYSLILPKMGI